MRVVMFAVSLMVTISGCAMQNEDGAEGAAASTEQAMCSDPLGCDEWLKSCKANGGKEGTPDQGVRMCCKTTSGGTWCSNDPTALRTKHPVVSPWPGSPPPVSTH